MVDGCPEKKLKTEKEGLCQALNEKEMQNEVVTIYFKSSLFEKCLQCFVKYETD